MSEELREKIARVIDPVPFKAHDSLRDYCIRHGDDEDTAERYANDTHGPDCDRALAKADSILALIDHLEADGRVEAMRDLPTAFENWWETSPRRNPDLIGYSDKKCLAFDAFSAGVSALPVLGVGR